MILTSFGDEILDWLPLELGFCFLAIFFIGEEKECLLPSLTMAFIYFPGDWPRTFI